MSVKIGDKFHAVYQDGNPAWIVTSKAGRGVYMAVSQDDLDYSGIRKSFTSQEIEHAKRWERTLNRLGDQHADFYASLRVGQVVHYHDGFNNFVRCEVVVGTEDNISRGNEDLIGQLVLQPVALVGEWKHDLPTRRPDGSVNLGYHASKIIERNGAWQANGSCVYESPSYSYKRGHYIDPRPLDAIDLSVPEMTPGEAEAAAAEQLRQKMIEALSDYRLTAAEAMRAALDIIEGR